MALDRNVNKDGRGKYALINLRTNQVQWGGDDQFFVIKYKDRFASAALQAYAQAVSNFAMSLPHDDPQYAELTEYAGEMFMQSAIADNWTIKKTPD